MITDDQLRVSPDGVWAFNLAYYGESELTMITFAIFSFLFLASGLVVLVTSAKEAPEGYEDDAGFHASPASLPDKVGAKNGKVVVAGGEFFPLSA